MLDLSGFLINWRRFVSAGFIVFGTTTGAFAFCQGTDLIQELQVQQPDIYDKLQKETQAIPYHTGKFFRISMGGTEPSYIFGTLHSGDPRITQFSPELLSALDSARNVAFELKEVGGLSDPNTMNTMGMQLISYIMATDADRVSTLFSADEKRVIEETAEKYGLPAGSADLFKPGFLGLAFSVPACEAQNQGKIKSIDEQLAMRVKNAGKDFIGLETLDEQLSVIAKHPPEVQKTILASAIRQQPKAEDIFETMIQFYAKGEIGMLMLWSKTEDVIATQEDTEHVEQVMDGLVDKRNILMFERSLPLVQEGGAFIAVGAAHLPGETGILKLYENNGYKIERLD